MAMTTKHFRALAEAIGEAYDGPQDVPVLVRVSREIARVCAADNERFDLSRFAAAVQTAIDKRGV